MSPPFETLLIVPCVAHFLWR